VSADLHESARQLLAARTEQAVRHTAVRGFAQLSGADRCEVLQPGEAGLESRASIAYGPDAADLPGPLETHASILEHSFDHGTAGLVDDLADVPSAGAVAPASETAPAGYRSLLCVSLDSHGLLVAADREAGSFSGRELESMQQLAALVVAALDRFAWGTADEGSRLESVARVVSHDVQNAIGVANGRLELAMDGDRDQLAEVKAAHERLLDLTDDLVTVLRTGDSVSAIEPVALEEAASTAWTAIEAETATLDVADAIHVLADFTSLCQLLENLFRNAVDHAGDDVHVRVARHPDADGFVVADDGPGIPPEERDAVFEMGYTTGRDRTGYGLSIVQRIADAHGWDVTVSESAAGGARFDVTGVEFA
jgi:signal transduction histidine kinase